MQVRIAYRPCRVGDRERPGCIGEEFHPVSLMECLPCRGVAAHLGHVAGDCERGDGVLPQPCAEGGFCETPRQGLLDQQIAGPSLHVGMEFPPKGPVPERCRIRRTVNVLDDDDRGMRSVRSIHGLQDINDTPRWVGDRHLTGEILVLDIDDQ